MAPADFGDHTPRGVQLQYFVGTIVVIFRAKSNQSVIQQYAVRISNIRDPKTVQFKAAARNRLPVVEAVEHVAKIRAPMKIPHWAAKIFFAVSERNTNQTGSAGIAEKITVHTMQGTGIAGLKRACRFVQRISPIF